MKFLEESNHMLLSNGNPRLVAYGYMAPRKNKNAKQRCV